jgi:hypothetical protein
LFEAIDQSSLLCDPFYQLMKPLGKDSKGRLIVTPGQLIWAHQIYAPEQPRIIDIQGYDPRDPSKATYTVKALPPGTVTGTHFPIKELGLRADENYYVLHGKKRPAVVLQTVSTSWGNKLYPEPYALVAPAFTFKPRHDHDFAYRIMAMDYPHLFYMPSHAHGLTEAGVLRFEHVQAIPLAAVEPVVKASQKLSLLSDDAWAILQHQFCKFMTGRSLDDDLETTVRAYHDLLIAAIEKNTS